MAQYASLDLILGKDSAELTALKQGEFQTEKLGLIPFSAISIPEYREIKSKCVKMVPNGTGGMVPDIDEDKMVTLTVMKAVEKDTRSDFQFNDKRLLEKFNLVRAEDVVSLLLTPGELYKFVGEINTLSGFSPKAQEQAKEEIKNS